MTDADTATRDHRSILIGYWMEKSAESMEAARSEYGSARYSTAVRNLYYSCFYALTSVLLKEGCSFKKHTAVKAALHKNLIKTGIVESNWGKFYNKIFDSRHEGDYQPLRIFHAEEIKLFLDQGAGFLAQMEKLLAR